jgi:hypothetical protein
MQKYLNPARRMQDSLHACKMVGVRASKRQGQNSIDSSAVPLPRHLYPERAFGSRHHSGSLVGLTVVFHRFRSACKCCGCSNWGSSPSATLFTPAFDRLGLPHEDEAPLRRSLLRLDALFSPVILENDVDSLNDFLARIGFAIDYDLVLQRFGTAN